jgi:magnesium-transporting ATPase (P-type)
VIPFNPIRKRQLVIIRPHAKSKYVRAVLKGAPEMVLPICNKYIKDMEGEEIVMNGAERERILKERIIEHFCKDKGLKAIVYAYKDIDAYDWDF